jgi:hypothetical protein
MIYVDRNLLIIQVHNDYPNNNIDYNVQQYGLVN